MLHPAYPIATERLLLRPLTTGDVDDLYAYYSRPEVTRYLYWGPSSRAEMAQWLAQRADRPALLAEGDVLSLAMVLLETGTMVGNVILKWLSAQHMQGETGFVLHPDHHGRGLAGEAARVMLRLGFEELHLHRIVGSCDARNKASARVMEKLGMRREAHLRENEFVKGEWTDEYLYAMLATEWAAAQG